MKKHEALKYAYDNYPKGTVFKNMSCGLESISSGKFHLDDDGIRDSSSYYYIYGKDKWAEIISETKEKKFILQSEDGVDMYDGDWFFSLRCFVNNILERRISIDWAGVNSPKEFKAFSTKEAAEKWISEQNKPKFITVAKDSQYPVEVYNDRIRIKCDGSENHSDNIIIRESELKEIYEAYYSLRD